MSVSAPDDTSFHFLGDQKDMGSITSLTKTEKNQDFSKEGVTKGVEDDIPDDDCILSEEEFNIDTVSSLDKVCDNSVNDADSCMMNNKVADIKEESLSKGVMIPQGRQIAEHVSDVSTESVPATPNLEDNDYNNKNITAENSKLHYDKYGKSFPEKQDTLLETRFGDTSTKCQTKEESCQYTHKPFGDKKSQIGTDVLKSQSETIPCSMQTEERVDYSHDGSGKNNESNIYKRSVIIETIMNILSRNRKQLQHNIPTAGAVSANVKSQTVDNKRVNKSYFHSVSSVLSVAPTETSVSNMEASKLQRPSVMPETETVVFDAGQVRKQLKSGVDIVISQLEKLQQALGILQFSTDNSSASTTSESLKNQIKGMMTAVTQMYHIVYNTPQNNIGFLDTLNQMVAQLRRAEEEILKNHDTSQDPTKYLLHFQETLDRLREGGMKG